MDKGRANIPRSSRRKKEETTYSEGEGENDTEEEGDDTSGTYTRSQDKLLDVMKLFMEQQTKQLQQQTLQWEQRFEAERKQREQMRKEKECQEERLKKEIDEWEMHLREQQS